LPSSLLVTGGLGYIGSHTCVALAEAGYELVILDSLANSKLAVLDRLHELTGKKNEFVRADVRERAALGAVFKAHRFDAVVHFAGLKSVAESVTNPQLYREVNVGGSRVLLEVMREHGVRRIVFSSSATVYGEPEFLPYTEDHPLRPANPYGETKLAVERLLAAEAAADPRFLYACLRYFNPIGAHPSGRIGEDPQGVPDNLLPYVAQVAVGRLPALRVYGNDYDTPDGTGVRDYIHVMDLAFGHVAALQYLNLKKRSITANLGTGRGHSVLEVVKAFERASGVAIGLEVHPRRPGDIASYHADPALAAREFGWRARLGIDDMCRDAWCWQQGNPQGYPADRP
jgi:UDP-glucose 4-epimerase